MRFLPNPETIMKKKVHILVGICSCGKAKDRRESVRRTWLSCPRPGIECVFFIGGKGPLPDDERESTVLLDAPDGYNELPAKVFAFFRHALDHYDFDWLFKCDDDTYLDLSRLPELIDEDYDLIGDWMVDSRRAPSGGAGYLVKRSMVERIVAMHGLPYSGAEDLIVGRLVDKLGGSMISTPRLHMAHSFYPDAHNRVVTAHWCNPSIMDAIHTLRYQEPDTFYEGTHPIWKDELMFYACGIFRRKRTCCFGRWLLADNGTLELRWQIWPPEQLLLRDEAYVGSKTILRLKEGYPSLADLVRRQQERSSLPKAGPGVPMRIHLDCGNRRLAGWLNLDAPHYDKTRPLPWENEEVDAYFLERGMEQLTAAACCSFFKEVRRTLKPGGMLRLAFIDIRAFAKGQTPALLQFLKRNRRTEHTAGAIETLLQTPGHRTLWTTDTLTVLLEDLGFSVTAASPGVSSHDYLQGLERAHDRDENPFDLLGMACVEAQKPGGQRPLS